MCRITTASATLEIEVRTGISRGSGRLIEEGDGRRIDSLSAAIGTCVAFALP
jgi:hypothetical protein